MDRDAPPDPAIELLAQLSQVLQRARTRCEDLVLTCRSDDRPPVRTAVTQDPSQGSAVL